MPWLPDPRRTRRFRNREGKGDFDFALQWGSREGVSALVRVRNEASKIAGCLRSILPWFDEVVVIDNGSDDGTAAIVDEVRRLHDPLGKITTHRYPFRLARFGPEHEATPADSVHSAVYFGNWSLARCRGRTICKWDGDMILLKAASEAFGGLLARSRGGRFECWSIAGQTVYRTGAGEYWEAIGEVNREVEIVPNAWGCCFEKRRHWERLSRPALLPRRDFEPVVFAELKYADETEFSHWSTTDWPSPRKRREWENFERIRSGDVDLGMFRPLGRAFVEEQLR